MAQSSARNILWSRPSIYVCS